MLELVWKSAVALIGLAILRAALYRKHWGHGGTLRTLIGVTVGAVLLVPILGDYPDARLWLVAGGLLVLFPWQDLYTLLLERSTRRGVAALAEEWGEEVVEEPETGLFTVERPPDGQREAWVGNALVELRSLHPGVSTHETRRMMAFVVRLERRPAIECVVARGRPRPAYHDREWRVDHTAQGQFFAMSMSDLLTEGVRETGGSVATLASLLEPDETLGPFDLVLADDPEAFDAVFGGPLLGTLLEAGARSLPFELNVTPTSVNILTAYCGEADQRAHLGFLDRLAEALMEGEEWAVLDSNQ